MQLPHQFRKMESLSLMQFYKLYLLLGRTSPEDYPQVEPPRLRDLPGILLRQLRGLQQDVRRQKGKNDQKGDNGD